jgi:hypothetical protein
MSTFLKKQLEQLKSKQEELEEKIFKEEERKNNLINNASIERLEELVKPITEKLDRTGKFCIIGDIKVSKRERLQKETDDINSKNLELATRIKKGLYYKKNPNSVLPKNIQDELDELLILPPEKNKKLLTEEIYITLINILKKQDERIKTLELKLNN